MFIESMRGFWMDYGEIIVLVSAAATLIGVVLSLIKSNSISETAVTRTETAEKSLSTEHSNIKANQTILLDRTADAKETMNAMKSSIDTTRESIINESTDRKLQYASLSDTQKVLKDSAENMGKFAGEFARLAANNEELTANNKQLSMYMKRQSVEIESLQRENAQLKVRLKMQKPQQQEYDEELEL